MGVPTVTVLSDEQWRAYTNRESDLMSHSRDLKVLLAQLPRFGKTLGERRRRFGLLSSESEALVPMMHCVAFKTLSVSMLVENN